MKFLLTAVNAKYIHSNPAVYGLKAYAKAYAGHIEIAEYTINMQMEEILESIYRKQADAVAFSCYIWNISLIEELITELHKISPELPIWLGGPEVSYCAKECLQRFPFLMGIMMGEGEETFLELMQYYVKENIELSAIRGIAYENVITAPRSLTDMDALPFLYEDLEPFSNRILYYESSRGCPFSCSYCLSSIDKQVRLRNIDMVQKELKFFLEHNVKQVKFIDRTFNCNHIHAKAIWRYITEHDNGITNFHFEIGADILDEEEIYLLTQMRPGLVQLEIGVQSTNLETISAIRRTMNLNKLKKNVERIKEAGKVHMHLDLIAGLPFEDYKSFQQSFNDVYALKPEQLQLGFLKVLKGSLMEEKSGEYGINYTSKPPYEVLYSNWISYKELRKLKAVEEMVEIYYNSNQFRHILPVVEACFPTPFAFYKALADYYEKKDLFIHTPSRVYRYEVLLEFAKEIEEEKADFYSELLLYDIYLRENMKSRPAFAKELSESKEFSKAFYQKEEKEFKYLKNYQQYDGKQMSKMTHIEPFSYAVWETDIEKVKNKLNKEQWILFDYKEKNPLNMEAKTYHL